MRIRYGVDYTSTPNLALISLSVVAVIQVFDRAAVNENDDSTLIAKSLGPKPIHEIMIASVQRIPRLHATCLYNAGRHAVHTCSLAYMSLRSA